MGEAVGGVRMSGMGGGRVGLGVDGAVVLRFRGIEGGRRSLGWRGWGEEVLALGKCRIGLLNDRRRI